MKRAWVSGALAVFLAHLAWFVLIVIEAEVDVFMAAIIVMSLVVMNVAGLGAFLAARLAPRHRLLLALTMAPLTAVLATLSNLMLRLARVPVDLSGFYNNVGLFDVSLAYGLFVSAVGGGIGMWVASRRVEIAVPVAAVPVVAEVLPQIVATPNVIRDELPQIRSD